MKDTVKKAGRAMEDRDQDSSKENARERNRRVARRLFQDDDDVNNRNVNLRNGDARNNIIAEREFVQELRRNQNDARRRWNFDFRTGTPLPGRYQWERIDNNHGEHHGIAASTRLSNGVNNSHDTQLMDTEDKEKEETNNSER